MAHAIVSFLIQQLGSVIKQEIEQEVRLVVGVKAEVRKLQKTFETLKAVLNDAEQRQIDEVPVKIWLDDLKNAAYQMEDVLDEWETKIRLLQLEKENHHGVSSSYLCSPFFSCFKQNALRHDIGSRIKAIRETLDSIREDKDQFQFKTSERVPEGLQTERTKTSYIIVDPDICGRDYDINILLNKLLGIESSTSTSHQNDETTDPRIISIIGMGGLGKTTLAQLLFNHDSVKSHFEIPMWVCVSDPFDLTMVAKAIIREVTKKYTLNTTWNDLHKKLCESIKGKKFFLVLDDVWTEDPNNLDPLKHLLVLGAEGSRMLVTTRNEGVASRLNSCKHALQILSPEDSRSLLRRKAFSGNENKENPELTKISFGISDKCHGLPLALSLLGSLLNKRIDEQNWSRILNSKFWELKGFDKNQKLLSNPAFVVSYDGLSSNLKNCFAYCAVFQKDQKIKKRTLIKLWMAQGLLHSEEPELLGEEYFDELAAGSFFQDFSVDNKGNIFFTMHDLIHDLALFLTNSCFISLYQDQEFRFDQENSSKPVHLSLIYNEPKSTSLAFFHESIKKVCNVRTLQTMRNWDRRLEVNNHLSSDFIHNLKCLRVLRLKRMEISRLPDEIDILIHLRYLDLSHNWRLYELPNSVCRLINLQTLKLKNCPGLLQLPLDMGVMVRMRNLDIRRCGLLRYLPKGIGNWRSLQTLSTFIISDAREGCKFEELKYQNLIQDHLEINVLEKLKTTEEAAEAELHKKSQLSELRLDFKPNLDGLASFASATGQRWLGRRERDVLEQTPEEVLAGSVLGVLQPHSNLKNLTIKNYLGFPFPSWMGSTEALRHLRSLNLNDCINCSELPALGLLPSLEVLGISQLLSLKRIGVEVYGCGKCITQVVFPKLKSLYISSAPSLEVWEFGNGQVQVKAIMPCLTSIYLEKCLTLKGLPALGKLLSLETLSIYDSNKIISIGHEFCGAASISSLSSLRAFPKLNSLILCNLRNLEVLYFGEMPFLKILDVQRCPKLKSLRFRTKSLPSLETLYLHEVRNLEEFKVEEEEEDFIWKLPRLLNIHAEEQEGGGEEEDNDFIWQLPRLSKIHLGRCDNIHSFPRNLPSLRNLYADGFPPLVSGPQPYLPISPNLTYLLIYRRRHHSPLHLENIAEFKELQQLEFYGSLEDLFIEGDWSILSHIPNITIGNQKIDPSTYS